MATLQTYVDQFIRAVGSKKSMREATKVILEKMISYEPHELTEPQKAQARENIGIADWSKYFGKVGKIDLAKGTHDVEFDDPFLENYVVFATGYASGAMVNVIVLDDSDLNKFTVKVPVACTVRWMAKIIIEF